MGTATKVRTPPNSTPATIVGSCRLKMAASPALLESGTHANVIVDFWGAPGKELPERCSSRSASCCPDRSQNCVALAVASSLARSQPPIEEPYSAETEYDTGPFCTNSALPHTLSNTKSRVSKTAVLTSGRIFPSQ